MFLNHLCNYRGLGTREILDKNAGPDIEEQTDESLQAEPRSKFNDNLILNNQSEQERLLQSSNKQSTPSSTSSLRTQTNSNEFIEDIED
jgi:hypothetical protein